MFTGIVEEIGRVRSLQQSSRMCSLTVEAPGIMSDTKVGDSICTNGVCLTVSNRTSSGFTADVMPETLSRSTLGALTPGSPVNLERALPADGRFGGHIVSGHIDGTGRITNITREANAHWLTIACDSAILGLIVPKGSIAIDGISLTVARVTTCDFAVSIIPHTFAHTTLGTKREGNAVNLENDIVGKYIARFMAVSNTFQYQGRVCGSYEVTSSMSTSQSQSTSPSRSTSSCSTSPSRSTSSTFSTSTLTESYLRECGF